MAVDGNKYPSFFSLEEISTRFFQFIRKNLFLFLITAILGAGLGLFYAFTKNPEYKSKLVFSLDIGSESAEMSGVAGFASNFGLNFGSNSGMFSQDNIIEIMRSRKIIENVLLSDYKFKKNNTTLIEYFLNESGARQEAPKSSYLRIKHFPVGLSRQSFDYEQKQALKDVYTKILKEFLLVQRPDKSLNIYQVSIQSWDETFSKVFTDRLISATDSFYKEVCTKKSLNTLKILESRTEEYKKNLYGSIDSKSQTMDANINPAFAITVAPIEKRDFDVRLYGEGYSALFKNLELARYQYLRDIPLLQIIDAADYPMDIIRVNKIFAFVIGAISGMLVFMLVSIVLIFRKLTGKKN